MVDKGRFNRLKEEFLNLKKNLAPFEKEEEEEKEDFDTEVMFGYLFAGEAQQARPFKPRFLIDFLDGRLCRLQPKELPPYLGTKTLQILDDKTRKNELVQMIYCMLKSDINFRTFIFFQFLVMTVAESLFELKFSLDYQKERLEKIETEIQNYVEEKVQSLHDFEKKSINTIYVPIESCTQIGLLFVAEFNSSGHYFKGKDLSESPIKQCTSVHIFYEYELIKNDEKKGKEDYLKSSGQKLDKSYQDRVYDGFLGVNMQKFQELLAQPRQLNYFCDDIGKQNNWAYLNIKNLIFFNHFLSSVADEVRKYKALKESLDGIVFDRT